MLDAYEHRCAVCGYDARIETRFFGIEAAHIKSFESQGPNIVRNGLALCSVHHDALDAGAIGLDQAAAQAVADPYRLIVSSRVEGSSSATVRQLLDLSGRPLREPQARHFLPDPQFVRWHREEVFRGQPRDEPRVA